MIELQEQDAFEIEDRIKHILKSNRIMSVATSDAKGPWSAPVFYAEDRFNLIFVSNPKSRHGRVAAGSGRYAASIYNAESKWRDVQGLQMEGPVDMLEDEAEVKTARERYTQKFPFTSVFFNQQDTLPAPLKAKVSDVRFFTFKPERIVLVDNSIQFGFHYDFTVER